MGSMTAAGTTLAFSAAIPATYDAAGFAALTFTEVGGLEKIGGIGATYAKVEFKPLKGATEKHKGSVDYGSLQPSMAVDETDAGQTLMRTASEHPTASYSGRVILPDGSKRYFMSKIFGMPETIDGADSIIMATPTVEINTKPIRVAAGG